MTGAATKPGMAAATAATAPGRLARNSSSWPSWTRTWTNSTRCCFTGSSLLSVVGGSGLDEGAGAGRRELLDGGQQRVHLEAGAHAALDGAVDEPGPAVGVVRAGEEHARSEEHT